MSRRHRCDISFREAYVKNLINVVGKGGGLIVDCGVIIDQAKHENVKAMVEFTKKYGVYT
jgi:hypothetical protein